MKYSLNLERAILRECMDWRFDPESPDSNAPFLYPDSVSTYAEYLRAASFDRERQWEFLKEHLDILAERNWIKLEFVSADCFEAAITASGMDRLDWHSSQDFTRKLAQFSSTTLGLALTSIVLPLLVSVGTIMISQHLAAGGGQ